ASAWGNGRYVRAEPVCREKVRDANGRGRVLVNPAEFGSSARVLQWAAWADSGRHGRANRCANGVRSCAKFSPQMSRPYMLEHKLRSRHRGRQMHTTAEISKLAESARPVQFIPVRKED